MGFPGGTVVKNPPAKAGAAGDVGSIPASGRPLEKRVAPHFSLLAGIISWTEVGYSPWGQKELDMTEAT